MEEKKLFVSFLYDADLIEYLRLHNIEYHFALDNTEIIIEFMQPKYLWMVAQNFGRWKEVKEIKKVINAKYS